MMTDLGTLKPDNAGFSAARAINDRGWIVGRAQGADDRNHATIWAEGRTIDLGCPGDCSSAKALAVNDAGQVVGTASNRGSPPARAYLWQDGAAVDLLTLLPVDSGWQLAAATGINDRGQIVGNGTYNGDARAFLLTLPDAPPAPTPSASPSTTPSATPSATHTPSATPATPTPSPAPVSTPSPAPSASPSPPGSPSPSTNPSPSPSPASSPGPVPRFVDVPAGYWAHGPIGTFAQRGITTGCGTDTAGNTYYCPERGVTRAEMGVFLDRTLGYGSPATPASQRFSDVPPAYWAYAFIDRFATLGITTGCGGTEFCPDRGVTRAEMAAFLIRALLQPQATPATPTFADVPASHPQYGSIEVLVQLGVTTGCGTNDIGQRLYCPDRGVTRAEMAVFIIRAFP